jgi:hypothetical protein
MGAVMTTKFTRRLVPAALLAALAATTAPPAHAADSSINLEAGLGCKFALTINSVGGRLHTKEFKDENGDPVRIITAGKGVLLTYINADTGASVTINTAGSVSKTVTNSDGTQTVSATGHNGLVMFPSDVPAGPSTTQYTGRIVYNVNLETGVFTLISTSGPSRDICKELSA